MLKKLEVWNLYVWNKQTQEHEIQTKLYESIKEAKKVFDNTIITKDISEIRLYDCTVDEYNCIIDEELIDEKY